MQSVVSACGGLSSLSLGMWAHAFMLRKYDGNLSNDVLLNNTLVDMYCKCGSLDIAKQVFDRMSKRDITCWNSMILGFAMHGKFKEALDAFIRICRMKVLMPNSITFIGVLTACNRGGLVNEGRKYFESMVGKYKIEPQLEHYGCIVDLLARAGLIEEALNVVNDMYVKPDVVIWRSLLDACSKQIVDVELSEEVARRILNTVFHQWLGYYLEYMPLLTVGTMLVPLEN
ncbi:hypothetical protein GIB67_004709 [Kingdonia uniflora]|uniref:Pentatricopeptide repeat-containing protein n=1 Tax=Kingdonia uniflora TaxID=39325 RepID=A0A7J7P4Z1_9MAGN|nr:hypothetical protein GIB67_004709 [Kingdonia uniflora]